MSALFAASSLFLLLGCSGLAGAEDEGAPWYLSGKDRAYPSPRYVVALGYGDNVRDADDMARGELTKVFSARVTSVSLEMDSFRQRSGFGARDGEERRFEARSFTRVKGSAFLEGAVIARRAEVEGVKYSLAVLDVNALKARWSAELSDIDELIDARLSVPASKGRARAAGIAAGLRMLEQRRVAEAKLRALGVRPAADARDYDSLFRELQRWLGGNSPIWVTCNDSSAGRLLVDALRAQWMVVVDGTPLVDEGTEEGKTPVEVVLVEARLDVEQKSGKDGIEFLYSGEVSAVQGKAVLVQKRHSGRIYHPSEKLGSEKVLLEVEKRLLEPFAEELAMRVLGLAER